MQRDELEREIRSAFQSQPYPGDDHLVRDDSGYDPNVYDLESNHIKKSFAGKQWHEVAQQDLMDTPQVFSFFTPEAYVYFLPAVMLSTLSFHPRTGYLFDNLVEKLTVHPGSQWSFSECFRLLTHQQKHVISQYLRFVTHEQYGDQPLGVAQIALERYWSQFL